MNRKDTRSSKTTRSTTGRTRKPTKPRKATVATRRTKSTRSIRSTTATRVGRATMAKPATKAVSAGKAAPDRKGGGSLTITTRGDRELVMRRELDAPRQMVWDAHTRPELVRRWLGVFGGWTMSVCEIDLKPGGRLRYVWRNTDGREMGMSGVYEEVTAPERLVNSEDFDDPWYQGRAMSTLVLTERAGRTTLTSTVRYDGKAIRDAVLRSGMETGVAKSYDRLAAILAGRK